LSVKSARDIAQRFHSFTSVFQIGLALLTTVVALGFIGQTSKNAIEEMEREDEQQRRKE
jgi:hypothetical protein